MSRNSSAIAWILGALTNWWTDMNRPTLFAGLAPAAITLFVFGMGHALAADTGRFLKPKAWQCSFTTEMDVTREEQTGPGTTPLEDPIDFIALLEQQPLVQGQVQVNTTVLACQ